MNRLKKHIILLLLAMTALPVIAQTRDTRLTIQVTSVEGDNLEGQQVTLMQTDYQVSYGTLKLAANGSCTLKVYAGNHELLVSRDGFHPVAYSFVVAEGTAEQTVSVELKELTRTPYALKASVSHDVFSGANSIALSWNTEEPAFSDDFESYTPFAVSFGQWTGIDGDQEVAAPLVGSYPNRGVMQYAQIINPLTVEPTWWYDYPILRPYEGQQYVGFTRTNSGNANDDWLITPAISVGTDNVLSFMAKAADRFPERFMVYVTTKTDNPQQSDFVRLDQGNYETADYTGWKEYTYSLAAYAGKQVKLAIRYVSHYNYYGSFMLMVDNVYVGQNGKSEGNPNERFRIYLDGELKATTADCNYTLTDVPTGNHTVGIQATYIQAESEVSTVQVNIPADGYARVTFNVATNSVLSADGQQLSLLSRATSDIYTVEIAGGKCEFASLPVGQYVVNIAEGAFNEYQQTIDVTGDAAFSIELTDCILAPYNITAVTDDEGKVTLRWNQELVFSDSFEDYDDFATGSFGDWLTIDVDKMPTYPIALGSATNIVAFPGSGTANNPTAIAPMVFNPWETTPSMLPTDPAIAAPTGDKTIIFFSSQRAQSDKWLISPLLDIHDNYLLSVKAKAYSSMYPEAMEFCVSDGSTQPTDFVPVSSVDRVSAEEWALYQTDLADYAGKTVRLAVHYISTDAFLTQVDDFTVGPEDGQGETVDYGNVVRFDILLDGEKVGECTSPVFVLPPLAEGQHTVGIKAVYKNGESSVTEYVLNIAAGIAQVRVSTSPRQVFNLSGVYVGNSLSGLPSGIYFVKQDGKTVKIRR